MITGPQCLGYDTGVASWSHYFRDNGCVYQGKPNLQFVDNIFQVTCRHLPLHQFDHLAAYCSHLGRLCICRLLDLVLSALCESDAEQAQQVAVSSLHIDVSFDHCLTTMNNHQREQHYYNSYTTQNRVKVLRPTQHKLGHFGDVLPSQSLSLVLKNRNKHSKSKHTSVTKYTTTLGQVFQALCPSRLPNLQYRIGMDG